MFRPYRELLATPGGLAFSAAGFVARMPIAMVGLGLVLLISAVQRSYGVAGAVSATFAVVNALAGPRLARLVDLRGQRRVLRPMLVLHVTGMGALLILAEADAPAWALFPAAAVAGAFFPQIGMLVRARWSHMLAGSPALHTAYSYESVLDELIFVVGPPLVTLLATRAGRLSGLLTALVLLVAGTVAFTAQAASEPPAGSAEEGSRSALRLRGLPAVTAVMVGLGAVFGSVEVVTVAFADATGNRPVAGLVLAVYALASMCAGIWYGAVHWHVPVARRFRLGALFMALALLPLPVTGSVPVLTGLIFCAGLAIAPTLIAGFGLVETLVPGRSLTEGLSWANTGLALGVAAGATVAGRVVDLAGAQRGFVVPVVAGALGAVAALRIGTHT